MAEITHVIPGPGKHFHGISEAATKVYRSIDPALPEMVMDNYGYFDHPACLRLWKLLDDADAFAPNASRGRRANDPMSIFYNFVHLHSDGGWFNGWNPKFAVPMCAMVGAAIPMPLAEAQARGMTWSRECAAKLGLIVDDRPPLTRVSWKGSRRAYMHALECEVCQTHGVKHCPIFPLLAEEKIESDVDPRLEELIN